LALQMASHPFEGAGSRSHCVGVEPPCSSPASAQKPRSARSSNGKFSNDLLNVESFDTLLEVQLLTEQWRKYYNTVRPHSALGYRPRRQSSHGLQLRLRLSLRARLQRPWG